MRRVISNELLDDDRGTLEEVRRSLDDLWRINRYLGGVTSNTRLLEHIFSRTGAKSAALLELGAGDGRLAFRLRANLCRRGIDIKFFAVDRRLGHLTYGGPARAQFDAVAADVFELPFPDRSFDVVMCNLVFHHFSGERARLLLRRMARVTRKAVLVNDTERHALPFLFARLGFMWRSRLTRHDAPASVRQAYTRDELAALAEGAGFRHFEIMRMWPFRLGLILWK